MAKESKGTVVLAMGANAAVALAKIVAGLLGGSAVMMAEAGHSVADTLNQTFMYVALRRSTKQPDRQHPFGYGKERFFWALIAAVGIFVAGAGFSLFEAVRAFSESPQSAEHNFVLNYLVFGFAAVAEAASWIRAYRQTRAEANEQNRSLSQHIRLSPDPTVKTVASEDTVAVIGDVLGLTATGLQQLTGQPLWDGVAALVIMVMLIFVAFALARDNKDLLIGEAIEPEKEQRIHQLLDEEPGIDEVLDVRSMRIGTDDVLIAARVDLGDNLDSAAIHQLTEHVDHKLRTELPEVSIVFIDPRRRPNQDIGTHRNGQA